MWIKNPAGCIHVKSAEFIAFSNKPSNASQIGIREIFEMDYITISPNPFTENTTVTFNKPSNSPYHMTIIDATGKKLASESIECGQFILARKKTEKGLLCP